MKNIKEFNIVICGTGGQGVITLQKVICEAAKCQGFDVKSSELHGLSQRGGSVESHIRFGRKIFSPLVKQCGADLIIVLEIQEAVRACRYASKENGTVFLVNNFFSPILFQQEKYSRDKISKILQKFSKEVIFTDASENVLKETGDIITAGIYMLGRAGYGNLFPLDNKSLKKGLESVISPKHLELNKKVFELAGKV